MAFFDDLMAVFDQYGVGLPPHLALQLHQLHVPPNLAPVTTVDYGFQAWPEVTNPDYAGFLFTCQEIAAALTGFPQGAASENVRIASDRLLTAQLVGAPGIKIEQFTTGTGQVGYRAIEPEEKNLINNGKAWAAPAAEYTPLPGMSSAPGPYNLRTRAGCVAYLNNKVRAGGDDSAFPH